MGPRLSHPLLQATGGMRSFLQQFQGCLQLLRELPPAGAASGGGDADMADAGAPGGAASSAAGAELEAYRQSVEAVVGTFLVLMTNMRWGLGAADWLILS